MLRNRISSMTQPGRLKRSIVDMGDPGRAEMASKRRIQNAAEGALAHS
jgi:hypothetical protein